jgi:2-(1,2-epoxy-1,2-dihydrophenyl)acetyl-CoA isomerase
MDTLDFNVEQGVGWIRLNRPAKRNPWDAELRKDLMQVLEQVREDQSIRSLVIAGTPGAFCAGGNLNMLKANTAKGPDFHQQRLKSGLRVVDDLLNISRPVIAVVDGPAFGAGFSLALMADMVLVSPKARFAMSYLKLGVVPDLGAMYLLPRVVGIQRAKELIFSMRELGAEEAVELGIAMEVHPSDSIEARAREIAQSLANASPAAVGLTKAALNASLDTDRQTMFTLEAHSQAAAYGAHEPMVAIDAMLAKQSPAYAGFSRPVQTS